MNTISTERLLNTLAWAEARVGELSGADVIVGAIKELIHLRAQCESRDTAAPCKHCYGTGYRMTHPAGTRERCFACNADPASLVMPDAELVRALEAGAAQCAQQAGALRICGPMHEADEWSGYADRLRAHASAMSIPQDTKQAEPAVSCSPAGTSAMKEGMVGKV